jgi:oligosaccharyltransferase complex subunit epsilon
VGQFVLTGIPTRQSWRREKTADWQLAVSLRIQSNPENKTEFAAVSPERYDLLQERAGEKLTFFWLRSAFADYVFGSVLLHFFCINFIN